MDKKIIVTEKTEQGYKIFYIKDTQNLNTKRVYQGYFIDNIIIDKERHYLSRFTEQVRKRYFFNERTKVFIKNTSSLKAEDIERIYKSCLKHWYK